MKKSAVIMLCAAMLFPSFFTQASETPALTPGPQPTPVLVTDLTPQAEETDVFAQPQDESPYAAAFFNVAYYALQNPDLAAASGGDEGLLRAHWLNYGIHEGRRWSPCFDATWYLENNQDLAAMFGTDSAQVALHYRTIGAAQGLAGSAEFDPDDYAQLNPDLAAQYGNDLRALAQHYNDQGFAEGRLAFIAVEATEKPQAEAIATAQPDGTSEPEAAADAPESAPLHPWPVVQNTLHKLKTIDKGAERAMAYRGPGKNYREGNAFVTSKMKKVSGLFIEGKYVLTEIDYAGVGKRRLYFMIGTFTKTGNTPVWDMEGFGAYTAADAFPRYGPGEDYNDFEGEVLPAGSPVSVFFEENGWVFMEFMSPEGLDRGWVPAEYVVPANQRDGSHVTVITPPPAVTATPKPTATHRPVTEGTLPVTPYPITPEPVTPEPVAPEPVAPEPVAPESFSLLPSFTYLITIAPLGEPPPLKVKAKIYIAWSGAPHGQQTYAIAVEAKAEGGSGNYSYKYTIYINNQSGDSTGFINSNSWIFWAGPGDVCKIRVDVRDSAGNSATVYTNSITAE